MGKATAKGKSLPPKRYNDMTLDEQWWLEQFWSGRLRAELNQAEKLTTKVQAKDFNVFDYDYEVDCTRTLWCLEHTAYCDDERPVVV